MWSRTSPILKQSTFISHPALLSVNLATLVKDIPFRLRQKIEDALELPDANHHDWHGMASVMNLNAEEVRRLENARENGKMKGLFERMIQRQKTVNDLLNWLRHPDVQRWDVIDDIKKEPNNISAALLNLETEGSESQLSGLLSLYIIQHYTPNMYSM